MLFIRYNLLIFISLPFPRYFPLRRRSDGSVWGKHPRAAHAALLVPHRCRGSRGGARCVRGNPRGGSALHPRVWGIASQRRHHSGETQLQLILE